MKKYTPEVSSFEFGKNLSLGTQAKKILRGWQKKFSEVGKKNFKRLQFFLNSIQCFQLK